MLVDCDGVSVTFEPPVTEYPLPDAVTVEICMFELPVFVSVTSRVEVLPTVTFPKLRLLGLAEREYVAPAPVPERLTTSGEPAALLVNDILPDKEPADFGEKSIVRVAFWPGVRVAGTVGPVQLKLEPDSTMLEIVRFALPEFVTTSGEVA
jgi:hypothetical protein